MARGRPQPVGYESVGKADLGSVPLRGICIRSNLINAVRADLLSAIMMLKIG